MNHKDAELVVTRCVEIRKACFLWGGMGIGKSMLVREIGEKLKRPVIDVRVSQLDPSDIRGIPVPYEGTTKWLIPNWLPKEGNGILFLDEFNLAPPLVQSSFYQLILDRKIGDYVLPDGWSVVCAGNRVEDRSNVFEMSWALANRFVHVYLDEPEADSWSVWAVNKGVDSRVLAFINFKPEYLFQFDSHAKEKCFPTPRTWEFLSDVIRGVEDEKTLDILAKCVVGTGVGKEFVTFVNTIMKIDIGAVLDGTKEMPTKMDEKYAMLHAVAAYLKAHQDNATMVKCIKLAPKIEPELRMIFYSTVSKVNIKLWLSACSKLKADGDASYRMIADIMEMMR